MIGRGREIVGNETASIVTDHIHGRESQGVETETETGNERDGKGGPAQGHVPDQDHHAPIADPPLSTWQDLQGSMKRLQLRP